MKLDCEVIRDLLPLYAEQMASPASTALVEEHLQTCEACRAELEQMRLPVPVQLEPQPDAADGGKRRLRGGKKGGTGDQDHQGRV